MAGTLRNTLTWQDNSNNETGFKVERKEGVLRSGESAKTNEAARFTNACN